MALLLSLDGFRRLAISLAALSVTWMTAACSSGADLYRLTDLGQSTVTNDAAQDITEGGKVGLQQAGMAYVWQDGTLTPSAGVPNGNTQMRINELGHIAGANNLEAYLWRNGTTSALGSLEGGYTFSYDINDLDQVIGTSYCSSINRYRGFLWQNGSMVDIGGFLPTGETRPSAINNAGRIVGSASNATTELPFVYDGGTFSALPIPTGFVRGEANGLSDNGLNIAGTSRESNFFTNSQATAWIGGTTIALGTLGFGASRAHDVNDRGQVVGSLGVHDTDPVAAFLWENGMMYNLNSLLIDAPGYNVRQAFGINNFGQIVGNANFGDQIRAVLLTPVPEPSTLGLTATGFVAWVVSARRKRRIKIAPP